MLNKVRLESSYGNTLEFESKFKVGDKVETPGFAGILVIEGIDEFLTGITEELHWDLSTLDYLEGRAKVNNGEPATDDELKFA